MLNKETLVLAVKLFLITALVTLCLALVNHLTAPVIAENTEKKFNAAQAEVLSAAERFEKMDIPADAALPEGTQVNSFYVGFQGSEAVGYVVDAVCSEGYGGDIEVLVGIGNDQKVQKINILELSETPGLGAKAQDAEFSDSYIGKGMGVSVVKNREAGENEISAISGATITSTAVTKAVEAALQTVAASSAAGMDAQAVTEIQDKIEQVEQETDQQLHEPTPTPAGEQEPQGENTAPSGQAEENEAVQPAEQTTQTEEAES